VGTEQASSWVTARITLVLLQQLIFGDNEEYFAYCLDSAGGCSRLLLKDFASAMTHRLPIR
jgi:hypothetical protein